MTRRKKEFGKISPKLSASNSMLIKLYRIIFNALTSSERNIRDDSGLSQLPISRAITQTIAGI